MNKLELISMSWSNLWRTSVRTILTTAGVAIGTAAVVGMVGIGVGLQQLTEQMLGGLWDVNTVSVMPKFDPADIDAVNDPFMMNLPPDAEPVRTLDDVAIRDIKKIEGVAATNPSLTIAGVNLRAGKRQIHTSLTSIQPSIKKDYENKLAYGRHLGENERNAVLLGYTLFQQLTEESEITDTVVQPVQTQHKEVETPKDIPKPSLTVVTVSLSRFNIMGHMENKIVRTRVAGVLAQTGGMDDMSVFIPLRTAKAMQRWQLGTTVQQQRRDGYQLVEVLVESTEAVERVQQTVIEMGFNAFSLEQILGPLNSFFLVIQIILAGIASIALLVSSLGIISAMIMSVYERTRDIGIMKVVGGSLGDIKWMFMTESAMIGFIGGIAGLLAGWAIIRILNFIGNQFFALGEAEASLALLPAWLAVGSLAFAVIVGTLSGVYPAHRATKISPLEAIRRE